MRLRQGEMIGLVSPSRLAERDMYDRISAALTGIGFRCRYADRLFANGWGYAASPEERAASFHSLVRDGEVKLVFFGGGEGADDVIPYLDYELISAHPKMYLSFSDGTSILNAIHFRTGLPVYYGQSPSDFLEENAFTRANFLYHITEEDACRHLSAKPWICVLPGIAQGELLAGYLDNFTYLANGGWIVPQPGKRYILALEEHRMFFSVEHVSDELARLENSPVFRQTAGVLFGQYDGQPDPCLLQRLKVLGQRRGIPVAYCEDFGHGDNHAILRLGAQACLDTRAGTLDYSV